MTAASDLITLHPAFTTKALLIEEIRQHTEPNSPAAVDLLFRIAHTDLAGSLTGGDTITPASYGL